MGTMRIIAFFAALALLSQICFAAISSQEALDFVSKTNNFLQQGETAEISPNVKITSSGKAYWVIAVVSGDSLSGFIPVAAEKASIPDSKALKKDLIETAYFLYNFDRLKKNAVRQEVWVFSSRSAKQLNYLAVKLQSEASGDLTLIETELKDFPAAQETAKKIESKLNTIYPETSALAANILDVSAFENSFCENPDTATLATLQKKFEDVFIAIKELDAKIISSLKPKPSYLLDVDTLRGDIGGTSLPLETKKSLSSLANAPNEITDLASISVLATDLNESISNLFDNAATRAQTLADNLETRIKRNSAYQVLYGQDNAIIEKTGYSTLSGLIQYILAEENVYDWKGQEELVLLRENWQKADSYYRNSSFETAVSFAQKSKTNALKIFADGFEDQNPVINTDLLITAIVAIIIVLIIIVAIRNRRKFASLVSGEGSDKIEFS